MSQFRKKNTYNVAKNKDVYVSVFSGYGQPVYSTVYVDGVIVNEGAGIRNFYIGKGGSLEGKKIKVRMAVHDQNSRTNDLYARSVALGGDAPSPLEFEYTVAEEYQAVVFEAIYKIV